MTALASYQPPIPTQAPPIKLCMALQSVYAGQLEPLMSTVAGDQYEPLTLLSRQDSLVVAVVLVVEWFVINHYKGPNVKRAKGPIMDP